MKGIIKTTCRNFCSRPQELWQDLYNGWL